METFSTLLALCVGNSPVTDEFPTQRPVTWSFDVFFDLRLYNGWVNNVEAGDLRCYHAHYDITVMTEFSSQKGQYYVFILVSLSKLLNTHFRRTCEK